MIELVCILFDDGGDQRCCWWWYVGILYDVVAGWLSMSADGAKSKPKPKLDCKCKCWVKSVSKNEGGIGQVRSLSHEDEN